MNNEERREIIQRFIAAYNDFDVDGMKAGKALRLSGQSEFEFKDNKLYVITDIS